jgi:hypothetical protein
VGAEPNDASREPADRPAGEGALEKGPPRAADEGTAGLPEQPAAAPAPESGPPGTPPPAPAAMGYAGAGAIPPPPSAPPAHGGAPFPHGNPPPPAPRGEADRTRAAVTALLNLSGLGLGYVLLRHWIGAALAWAATALLLLVSLPADVDGIPAGILVGYGVLLLVLAADGARRGLCTPLRAGDRLRRLALPLALVLLLVPVGGSLAYGAARDEAKEQALLERLAAADTLVESADGLTFGDAQPIYRRALGEYQDLATEHKGSRAAKRVPASLDTLYEKGAAPYAKQSYCEAVAALTYLRTLPRTFGTGLLGNRPARTDGPLAHSLYECGVAALGREAARPSAGESLNTLHNTFPDSDHAAKVEPAVRDAIRSRTADLTGDDPCDTKDELRALRSDLDVLADPAVEDAAEEAASAVEKGDFACGTWQFRNKDFDDARTTMNQYAEDYPDSDRSARARSVAIAAEIAEEEPEAGRKLPPASNPGGSRMLMVISNDGPGSVEVLYTGPVTGRVTLKTCTTCTKYSGLIARGAKPKVCTGPSSKYPKATLLLPAGSYHFLQKRAPSSTSLYGDTKTSRQKIEPGYSYTNCLYVTSLF